MEKIKEVIKQLKNGNIMFLASFDGEKPKVRPVGFVMEFKGKMYFSTSEQGSIYRELNINPNFEVVATDSENPYNRIRVSGKVLFDKSENVYEEYYRLNPEMKNIPNMILFYMDEWEAIIYQGFQDRKIIKE